MISSVVCPHRTFVCVSSLLCSKVGCPCCHHGHLWFSFWCSNWCDSTGVQRRVRIPVCVGGFLDEAKLVLQDCCESQKEVIVESVSDQQPLAWGLSGLLVSLIGPVITLVLSRCLTRKRARTVPEPTESNDGSGKDTSRKVAPPRRGGGLVA